MSELAKRLVVAGIGIPLAVIVIRIGGWWLGGVLALVAAGAALELYRMAAHQGIRPFDEAGAVAAAGFVLIGTLTREPAAGNVLSWVFALLLVLYLLIVSIWRRGVGGRPLAAVAVTALGALLTGGTLAYGLYLRHLLPPAGQLWTGFGLLAFPLTLTWMNDTFAYFGGRRFGRRKLSPSVSPGKTVEGSAAGILGAIVVGVLYAAFIFDAWLGVPVPVWAGALGGLLLAVLGQLGDLVESLLKREAGVKDSGELLPGHGGLLDRFDALFFTVPAAYWYIAWVLGA